MVSLPQSGPQRSEFSAGTVFGGSRPIRFPRESGGLGTAVALLSRERASAQWALRGRDVRVVLKRKHPPCRGGSGGLMSFWLPASAQWSLGAGPRLFCRGGKTRDRNAGGQEPQADRRD